VARAEDWRRSSLGGGAVRQAHDCAGVDADECATGRWPPRPRPDGSSGSMPGWPRKSFERLRSCVRPSRPFARRRLGAADGAAAGLGTNAAQGRDGQTSHLRERPLAASGMLSVQAGRPRTQSRSRRASARSNSGSPMAHSSQSMKAGQCHGDQRSARVTRVERPAHPAIRQTALGCGGRRGGWAWNQRRAVRGRQKGHCLRQRKRTRGGKEECPGVSPSTFPSTFDM
jgi:hypothetical protein